MAHDGTLSPNLPRPALPDCCNNELMEPGYPVCKVRSTPPTSTPSSRAHVPTTPHSFLLNNRSSMLRRASAVYPIHNELANMSKWQMGFHLTAATSWTLYINVKRNIDITHLLCMTPPSTSEPWFSGWIEEWPVYVRTPTQQAIVFYRKRLF